ncbi:MAG: crossover junction endodeoxyribonuclease RuvC [Eubacteriales bacterium]|nr:crossover junction endodeoxyribonuclease RuvC [Eubacteriales bacterium]MDD4389614.1 crossover junction endodeoxyribonuclease RuvC [Eubacteriales bacterium]
MKIIGIDPGYACMGWGVVDLRGNSFSPVAYDSIITYPNMDMPERLKIIYNTLVKIINECAPEAASIEELFFNTNSKTAILVSQARGVAILACVNAGIPIYEYTPLQIKQALVGYGRAEKRQVQVMVKTILGLSAIPKPDDTADALAAAICHGHSAGSRNRLLNIK